MSDGNPLVGNLDKLVPYYANQLREGIAWIAIWKKGRSWQAEDFYLGIDDKFEDEQQETEAAQIILEDPNAVFLNGYYTRGFSEEATLLEIRNAIQWHYYDHHNLLKDSDAFHFEEEEYAEEEEEYRYEE